MRRFVFVPILGDTSAPPGAGPKAWENAPHIKAWGWFEDDNGFWPIHTDPPCQAVELDKRTDLFEAEKQAMVDITDDDDIPTEVAVALARMALLPVRQAD
jgi:hypothetical protein